MKPTFQVRSVHTLIFIQLRKPISDQHLVNPCRRQSIFHLLNCYLCAILVGYSGNSRGYFDRPPNGLRVDLETQVFRFVNVTTRFASLFKRMYSASPTRKQQSSARARPGSRFAERNTFWTKARTHLILPPSPFYAPKEWFYATDQLQQRSVFK